MSHSYLELRFVRVLHISVLALLVLRRWKSEFQSVTYFDNESSVRGETIFQRRQTCQSGIGCTLEHLSGAKRHVVTPKFMEVTFFLNTYIHYYYYLAGLYWVQVLGEILGKAELEKQVEEVEAHHQSLFISRFHWAVFVNISYILASMWLEEV